VRVDEITLQGPPKAFDENVVQVSSFPRVDGSDLRQRLLLAPTCQLPLCLLAIYEHCGCATGPYQVRSARQRRPARAGYLGMRDRLIPKQGVDRRSGILDHRRIRLANRATRAEIATGSEQACFSAWFSGFAESRCPGRREGFEIKLRDRLVLAWRSPTKPTGFGHSTQTP
jgi:hypothetical protein